MAGSISQDKPFRFLDLPQEIQDKVIKHYYATCTITASLSKSDHASEHRSVESPSASLLQVSKHIHKIAHSIRLKAPIKLCISRYFPMRYAWIVGTSNGLGRLNSPGLVGRVNTVVLLDYKFEDAGMASDCALIHSIFPKSEGVVFSCADHYLEMYAF